jgi:DNA-binding transcriptional LysR family regulator
VSPAELARTSLLLGTDGSSTRIVIERSLARGEYRPSRVWVFDSYEAIRQAVVEGLGISFMSELLVRQQVERGELIAFRVAGIEPMLRPMQMVQSTARDITPESATFMALVSDLIESAIEIWRPGVVEADNQEKWRTPIRAGYGSYREICSSPDGTTELHLEA